MPPVLESQSFPGGGGGGGGAPTDATYLLTTADPDLSAEIVVGATPGGELGGTWASPTVDATHSGSSHASIQAAAEATAEAYTDDAIADLPVATSTFTTTVDESVAGQVRHHLNSYVLDSTSAISNNASEVSLLDNTWDIPANTLAVGDIIRFVVAGEYLNNSGADRTVTFQIEFDGSHIFTFTTPNIAASASTRFYRIMVDAMIVSFIGTRVGLARGEISMSAAGGGTSANLFSGLFLVQALPTVDLTQVINVDVRAQMSTNNATQTITPGIVAAFPSKSITDT